MTEAQDRTELLAKLRARATSLGFSAFGVARADARPDLPEKLETALARHWHGEMAWMAETVERRAAPAGLWPGARSVIMLGMNYGPDSDPMSDLSKPGIGNISVYARNRDYHDVVKGKLKEIAGLVRRWTGKEAKVFVDTAPVMEKPLAEAAGIGWQGKHTVLVSRDYGSWLFLGAIFTAAEFPADDPHPESCGNCRRCLDVCPTDAFPAPFQLDARRCLSYLNIEHPGPIPHEFRTAMGNRIYGCDDCLAVCPWNKFASATREMKLMARDELRAPALADLLKLDEVNFRALFTGSPIKRIGHARFLRNVLVAAGNSADGTLVPLVEARLGDPDPLIRGAAVWAVRRLVNDARADALRLAFLPDEDDMSVQAEWSAAVRPARAN
ncbi:tRNA epoxyqueuosine(34) reductase QueG [Devosia sp.]|uniref:tRNA epoxyqueuosine(34) reductase QueG n=1 Tax=Devosia sp. TaxID=1871048 RepID=UPI001ACD80FD|nr:tRNA epoxyqueuosine(34) reductase QueG [Devosia sp.]MBN9310067.1 tRNA epoxyqueuosine(34) reductase QueG [Devosia sp.]